jgi:exosortase/archaeosortase family protein
VASELNARIGRTMPSPMFGVLVLAPDDRHAPARGAAARWRAVPPVMQLLAALVASLWPHWLYMGRRLADGSDEPWGILAALTVLVLVIRERRDLRVPARSGLVACGGLALLAALARLLLPDLAAAAIAMLAFGVFLAHALPQRPATPLIALLLLALPVIASLQFYLGYPLRALTAHASAAVLGMAGVGTSAIGASLLFDGRTILVDAPCAGIGMLWVGSYTAALLSWLNRANALRTALNALAAGLLVLAANVARNTALFFPEAGLVDWPSWSHDAIGLAAFAIAIVPIVHVTARTRI